MKKILSVMFSVFIIFFLSIPAFLAAEVELAGVDAAEPAVTEPGYIYFEAPPADTSGWSQTEAVYCHISNSAGEEIAPYLSKKELCEQVSGGYWRYDLKDITFDKDGEYTVIFANNTGSRTHSLCITSDCLGDIAYCENYTNLTQAPVDDQKVVLIARWKTHKDTVLPAAEDSSYGGTVNIDGVDPSAAQTKWGTGAGGSYELYTPAVTQETAIATSDELTEQDIIADKSDGINLRAVTIAIVSVSVVLGGAIIILTVKLAKRNISK